MRISHRRDTHPLYCQPKATRRVSAPNANRTHDRSRLILYISTGRNVLACRLILWSFGSVVMCVSSYLHYYRVLADYSREFDSRWGQIPDGSLLANSTVG